jgi:predicted metalloprotease
MKIEGRRRSSNFEDRGRGGGGGGAVGAGALFAIFRLLGPKGALALAAVCAVGYFVLPDAVRQQLLGALTGSAATSEGTPGASVCTASAENGQACDFSRVVLASTEDVWRGHFASGALPSYGRAVGSYVEPTLVVFAQGVSTGGCGNATSAVGPFYCPADKKLYIDPDFYAVMERKLRAPGDFAQAYVIAHEVGHHVQNLIGSNRLRVPSESENQISVRVELQADCFAGVWGHNARASLEISEADLEEALKAAHAIGDDALGHSKEETFTHGTSAQRKKWFRRGFESGDARKCDTFAVPDYAQL